MSRKSQRHLWLLSGTGDGPPLAEALVLKGWKVSVSVVSMNAALSYSQVPLQELFIGSLEGTEAIRNVIKNAKALHDGFDWIIDATHPFAQVISSNLKKVCREFDQPLICLERNCETIKEAFLIQSHNDLKNFDLKGQKLLFAIGSRMLPEAVKTACQAGAIVFARVMPTLEGISLALASNLPENHIAALRPLKGDSSGQYEAALCRRWGINGVISRQSGGITQKLWQKISKEQGLDLWMISRPNSSSNYCCTFKTSLELLDYLSD